MCQAVVDFLLECLMLFFEFRKVRLHRHPICLLNPWPQYEIKCSADSSQERRYTRLCTAAIGAKAFDRPRHSHSLNELVENAIIAGLCRGRWLAAKRTRGGDDAKRRTRVAGAVGAPAAGTPRSRRRDRGPGDVARL